MKVRTWVEVFTTTRFDEMTHDVDDHVWAGLTVDQREKYMATLFEDHRNDLCNGGYEALPDARPEVPHA